MPPLLTHGSASPPPFDEAGGTADFASMRSPPGFPYFESIAFRDLVNKR